MIKEKAGIKKQNMKKVFKCISIPAVWMDLSCFLDSTSRFLDSPSLKNYREHRKLECSLYFFS